MEQAAWRRAGAALVAKAVAELSYEGLLTPESTGDGAYRVAGYAFAATRGSCDGLRVTGVRAPDGTPATDPVAFLVAAAPALELPGATLAEAVQDLTATWAADAHLLTRTPPAAELAAASYATLDSWSAGHPCMLLSKGRLGFRGSDAAAYAPEHAPAFRLPWLAVHPSLASAHGVDVLGPELDDDVRARFAEVLGAGREAYVWLPVHPFHLDAVVRTLFAPYLADGRIVVLGEGPDRYAPLASVRTLANLDRPDRHDVKLPLLVRNTLVWRGLPAAPTAAAPEVSAWLRGIVRDDPVVRATGFDVLAEEASVAVRHPVYEALDGAPYRFHELLGAVWREPVAAHLRPDERARSLAALLQTGSDGRALIVELVARSGIPAPDWLRALFHALLPGLLRFLHAHGVAFCPHGENTVVVYDARDVPVRVRVKDLAEDVNLLPSGHPTLPPAAAGVLLRWPREELAHSILSALVAGVLRHLAPVVEAHLGVPERAFWSLVRDEVVAGLDGDEDPYGLLAPRFGRVCLNAEQLTGGGFHDRAEKDEGFDVIRGTVPNPLAVVA